MKLQIYRGNDTPLVSFEIDTNTKFSETQMAEKQISCSVVLPFVLPVQLGDYIIHKEERYRINTLPEYTKSESDNSHKYNIRFESPVYTLHDKYLMHEGTDDFSYYGTANHHLLLLVDNMNQIDLGWTLGDVEVTEPLNIDYSAHSCRTALSAIAEKFKLEFYLKSQQIYMVKTLGVDTNLQFEFGRGKGLYELTRKTADNQNVVTRVYGFGGSKNVDYTYRNGAKKLVFQEKYLEKNIDLYGIKEGRYENPEIFPNRTGMVTAVLDKTTIVDSSIDFDLNAHFQEGEKAKIIFKSGALANYEFEISKYNHAKKAIYFNVIKESNDYSLPNELNLPEVNAKYTLINIRMPESYITAAENKIKADTATYLEENSVPRVVYGLKPDEKYIRDNGIKLRVGDRITLIDHKLPINASLRIATMAYALVNEADIEVSISNFIPYTLQDRLVATAIDTKKEVQQLYRGNAELARRNSLNLFALRDLIIDPEGNYFTDKIKPGSIETLYFSNGAKSTNFALKNVAFTPNAGGDASKFTATAGQLVHFSIKIEGVGFVWEMQPLTVTGLLPAVTYYLYARVSRTSLVGSWLLSTEVLTVESEVDHFILQTGVIYPVLDGYRNYDLTKGMVFIIGDQITAGKLKSIDGLNFFDMTDGKFNLGDANTGIDWDVTTPGTLTIRGALASNILQVGSKDKINAFVSGITDEGDKSIRFGAGGKKGDSNLPFKVLDNGQMFATSGKIGSFTIEQGVLKTSDYSTSGTAGVWISNEGIVSRNSGASFIPASSGIVLEGSFVGETSKVGNLYPDYFPSGASAGVVGVRRSELTEKALDNTRFCRGVYGGFFSSFKNIGAEYKSIRWSDDGAGSEQMGYNDHFLVVTGAKSSVLLPESPDLGMEVTIKNGTAKLISIKRSGSTDTVINIDNVASTAFDLGMGDLVTLIYTANDGRWLIVL